MDKFVTAVVASKLNTTEYLSLHRPVQLLVDVSEELEGEAVHGGPPVGCVANEQRTTGSSIPSPEYFRIYGIGIDDVDGGLRPKLYNFFALKMCQFRPLFCFIFVLFSLQVQ